MRVDHPAEGIVTLERGCIIAAACTLDTAHQTHAVHVRYDRQFDQRGKAFLKQRGDGAGVPKNALAFDDLDVFKRGSGADRVAGIGVAV